MGLFSRKKGDPMSRKKRPTDDRTEPDTISDVSEEYDAEAAAADDDHQEPELEPQREDETDEAFKARQVAYAQQQLTLAEQQTSALYARRDGESAEDYQSRLDELTVRGQQPAPVDSTYQMPEAPTLVDQRAYLVHYALATEEEAEALDAEAIGTAIAQHAADLASRREQGAMRGELTELPVNPSLAQLRTYVTTKGLARAELVDTLDVAALQALVVGGPPEVPSTIDLTPPTGELGDIPFGGDPPKYYVVLETRALYLEGVSVTLSATQIINDRSHDIAGLKKLGVRLIETVHPVTAGSV